MSTFALTSSTISTRHSDSSLVTVMAVLQSLLAGGRAQRRQRSIEVVAGDQPGEAGEVRVAEEGAQLGPLPLEVVAGPRVALREQAGPALHHRPERRGIG